VSGVVVEIRSRTEVRLAICYSGSQRNTMNTDKAEILAIIPPSSSSSIRCVHRTCLEELFSDITEKPYFAAKVGLTIKW
jgi:hypothetical protein